MSGFTKREGFYNTRKKKERGGDEPALPLLKKRMLSRSPKKESIYLKEEKILISVPRETGKKKIGNSVLFLRGSTSI